MNSLATSQPVSLASDRAEINRYLRSLLHTPEKTASDGVADAMGYAVLGSGQRIRPILSLRVARLLGAPSAPTLAAASAVELLHCASLIIDDLPCMDNAAFRRDRAAVHVRFGEATAILAAFALVALAPRLLLEMPCEESGLHRGLEFQLALLRTLDCRSLIAGQALDLALPAADLDRNNSHISELKTVPLFTLAVQAGSLVATSDTGSRPILSVFGREFGLAFQMSDDLLDGEENNLELFYQKLDLLRGLTSHFGPAGNELESLVGYLHDRVSLGAASHIQAQTA